MRRHAQPRLQTTTLWHHPSQQYGDEQFGDPRYTGRTPAYVVWNVLERYTRPGDRVLDPFAGGGTAVDVARSMERVGLGFDLAETSAGLPRADARHLPLVSDSVDFVFMDPPYSTHVDYSEDGRCIGKLDAFEDAYFEALDGVFAEAWRVLRDRRFLAVYVQDTFVKKRGFVSIGAELYVLLRRRFRPVDHVAVVRGNRNLEKPNFHRAAAEGNFFLRGFNHLLLFKKEVD
ncbi:TRM11 family SAM-dependent methyltransferase [Engelhardtia mirabilis]|uniref:Putative methyltransferase n=1 Tax=Engelhardtia mirabilis TaxID=2528011 RepID=A0A518BQH7_9BACT|nr:putative methyltransferase [Planctomycetes bacterium Pla133]QDV03561.1 putative methyltransferase [Planctomycetes bacterium Pla86]